MIKKIIKNFLPTVFWTYLHNLKHNKLKYKGSNNLDRKIENYVNYNNGYFVELGANDGISQSNSYYFEKYRGWNGILIEPIPHNYLKCIKNRSKKTKAFCNACVSFDYNKKFVEMIYSNLMTTAIGLENDIEDLKTHARIGEQFLEKGEKNFRFGVIAKTLNNILLEANSPKQIDFLSLDVEGSEIEVLKGIDHKEYRFNYICIETRDLKKVADYLDKNNYLFIEQLSPIDYLFKDKN